MRLLTIAAWLTLLAAATAAQDDWTPKYTPPTQKAPADASAQPAQEPKPAEEPAREFNEEEPAKPAAPAQAVAPGQPQAAAAQPPATAGDKEAPAPATVPSTPRDAELRALAERFAPVFHHRLAGSAEEHRFDFPTNFDFDRDWVGNNNWEHAGDPKYKLWSYAYYSVIESEDHYFILYALFHPRDWSTAQAGYKGVLDTIQERWKDIFSKGAREQVEFNHENDLEGALVIVDKWGERGPAVVAVETVAHNHLLRALAPESDLRITSGHYREPLKLSDDGRPILYVESQKHGIRPWVDEEGDDILTLRYGKPVEFSQVQGETATYELISFYKTWWPRAQTSKGPNLTFGTVMDFADRFCEVPGATKPACAIGVVGAAIRGDFARPNSAVAPWAWFDVDDPQLPAGAFFFDPLLILRRHFGQFDSTQKYLFNPYLGIDVLGPKGK